MGRHELRLFAVGVVLAWRMSEAFEREAGGSEGKTRRYQVAGFEDRGSEQEPRNAWGL